MDNLIQEAARLANTGLEHVRLVRSPYRICPLGAHIDHQFGRVTGMALDSCVRLAFVPNREGNIRLRSRGFNEQFEFRLADAARITRGWGRYAAGACLALGQNGHPVRHGITGVIDGPMPSGGLSSSAAVTLAYLLAFEAANGIEPEPWANIRHEQFVENVHIGLNNGILDQAVIALSRRDHLLYLDCASLEWELIPAAPGAPPLAIAVVYSGLARALANTGYNTRVAECREAATRLLEAAGLPLPETPRLRDVPVEVYEQFAKTLPEILARRARHFFTENERVERGCKAWARGDYTGLGELVNQSGLSSIENYECGCLELTTLYEILRDTPGVYGARFSGAGFRGCCIALYRPGTEQAIRDAVDARYPAAHPHLADAYRIYFCASGDGASLQ